MDIGQVLEYNGMTEMKAWSGDECNQISGTDGTLFPPFADKNDGFTFFIPQMCRSITTIYQYQSNFHGLKTNHFTLSFDVRKYGIPNCYCRGGEICPPEGLLDIFDCVGTTIGVSMPHFYNGKL